MRWYWLAAIAGALLLLWWFTQRQQLPSRSPFAPSTGGGGSILDSANAGASKIRTLFATIFGGGTSKPPETSPE